MQSNYLLQNQPKLKSYDVDNYLSKETIQNISNPISFNNMYSIFPKEIDNHTLLPEINDYILLPEEYDVFSNIKKELNKILIKKNEQSSFIKYFYNIFSDSLKEHYYKKNKNIVLPKFSLSKDEEGAYIFDLNKSTFRLFINFEKNKSDSFYGYISQDEEDSYTTKNGRISENNCSQIIDTIIDLLS